MAIRNVRPRAPGAKAQRSGFHIGNSSYLCREYAVGKEIADEERANADPPLDLDGIGQAVAGRDNNGIAAAIVLNFNNRPGSNINNLIEK